jgi:uncharacterized protein (TIGR03435 family)
MKKLILWAITCAALPGCTLLAQSLPGTWQGTLQAGRDLRIVIKISTSDADTLKGVMYSIDQQSPALPTGPVTLKGTAVKIPVPGIGGTFEGTLSADGNSIAGTWSQGGPAPLNLTLKRATPEMAWTIPEPPKPLKPMAADANPVFEVATIKPSKPDTQGRGFQIRNRRFVTINTSLSNLIEFAYGIHPRQITGAPAWMETDKYDLEAQPDGEGQPNDKQWKIMVQKLLADRFKLTFHRDTKELSVYALVVGKTGPKLTKSEGDPNGLPALFFRKLGVLPARNASMKEFAGVMQSAVLDRPVVDHTDLAGKYDFTLTWTPDEFQFAGLGVKPQPTADADAAPDLFTAMQQQLGLKLESTKAQVEVLVIDHAEKPSAN